MRSKGKMLVGIGIAVLVVLIAGASVVGWRNTLISLEEQVKKTWADVDNQLQRRMDLIPNLVETVKGYAAHENEVLTNVTKARASVASAGTPGEQIEANNQLTSALARLMVVVEKYPDLKANQNFLALQDELAGTENRIAVERRRYNDAVNKFNATRRKIPYSFVAGGFKEAAYFTAAPGAKDAPQVKF